MPSSSSATSSRSRIHELFLSFRGKDTRHNFVSHLYEALKENGIDTFIDDRGIVRGKEIGPALSQEIQESRIAVVVLSKNYSDSSWCMDELVEINHCRKKNKLVVFPVFYNVRPSHVKNLEGDFGEAFKKHKDAENVDLWRQTLGEIGNLSGWDLTNPDNWNEASCVKKIVDDVNRELDKITYSIDENWEHDVGILAILGMPGSGKTTTAKEVFKSMRDQKFDGRSFVDDICDVSKSSGLVFLQKKILSDVFGHEVKVRDENDGCKKIRRRLSKRKVLIVLDNIDSGKQLKALVGKRNWFGDGSRIIITTTDERLLVAHKLNYSTHKVSLLNDKEATQLLIKCAFQNDIPTEAHKEFLDRVIRYAAGHPAALKFLGSKLIGRPIEQWKDTIDKLAKCPEAAIVNMLEMSLEGLDSCEKELFLDIACFFNGWKKDDVTDILDSCGLFATSGLTTLKEKSLITFAGECIQMHNLILELGRNIVRQENPHEPSKRSRLWHPEEVKDVLTKNKGTKYTKAIVISSLKKMDARAAFDAFTGMRKLRLLHASTRRMVFLVHDPSSDSLEWIMEGSGSRKYQPCDLKWLTWDNFDLESWPIDFHAKKLVGLQMRHSNIVDICSRKEKKFLDQLKFLDLSFSKDLTTTPNFEYLPHLEKLNLEFCSSLVQVHPSIKNHCNLVCLNLRSCEKLESLPSSFEMRYLEDLNLSWCSKLTKIPDFVGMTNLSVLDLSHNLIKELPLSICDLPSLIYLDIGNCRNLISIPPCIGMLYDRAEILCYGCPGSKELCLNLHI